MFVVLILTSCSIPKRSQYHSPYGAFLPPTRPWKEIHSSKVERVFSYPKREAVIGYNSTCQVSPPKSMGKLSQELFGNLGTLILLRKMDFVKDTIRGHEFVFEGGTAQTTFHLLTVVLNSNECQYDFSMITKPESFEEHRATLMEMVDSFVN